MNQKYRAPREAKFPNVDRQREKLTLHLTDWIGLGVNSVEIVLKEEKWSGRKLDRVGPPPISFNALSEKEKINKWHVTCDTWHVTRDTWHVTCATWNVTHLGGVNILSKFQLPSSSCLRFMILWGSGGKGSLNQSMNHEAVYRTAPATPGLLKTLQESQNAALRISHWLSNASNCSFQK